MVFLIMGAMLSEDERFMAVALELARRGRGAVEPNPMVGAVLVRDGVELGRGWHGRFGGPHAEIEALGAARSAGLSVRGATMYVTLEPCCHHGKTPPCVDAIIQAGVSRVVVAMEDPDGNVSGRGIAALREAGLEVTVGVMAQQARSLLGAYCKLRTVGRPWVICKWAQTADGLLELPPGQGRWISGPEARAYVQKLRGLCDGVCVGIGTVLADDPLLTNRTGQGRQPTRLVLDSQLRIPRQSQLLRTARKSPLIVATSSSAVGEKADVAEELRRQGVELLELGPAGGGVDLPALLDELGRRQWTHLLVEGGSKVLGSFVLGGLADELLVFVSPRTVEQAAGLACFDIAGVRERLSLFVADQRRFGEDMLHRYVLRQ